MIVKPLQKTTFGTERRQITVEGERKIQNRQGRAGKGGEAKPTESDCRFICLSLFLPPLGGFHI